MYRSETSAVRTPAYPVSADDDDDDDCRYYLQDVGGGGGGPENYVVRRNNIINLFAGIGRRARAHALVRYDIILRTRTPNYLKYL